MPENLDIIAITALLPITACMVVTQVNPYHALVIRGILGAVAALVYALFGAADVALTEALVGTMLSITLYAIAVRSSMSLRLGVLENDTDAIARHPELAHQYADLLTSLRKPLRQYHIRLEFVTYPTLQALYAALQSKDVHAVCYLVETEELSSFQLQTRVQRLYEILKGHLAPKMVNLSYVQPAARPPELHATSVSLPESLEVQP